MFNGKIDFMDFNKIRINYGGKLTCKGIFNFKFIIFLIISGLFLIILISIYSVKSQNLSKILSEIADLQSKNSQIDNEINIMSNKIIQDEINLKDLNNNINQINIDLQKEEQKEKEETEKNKVFLSQKEEMEKAIDSLNQELKTESDLKEVYIQKISSLKGLLESSQKEYKKLL